MGGESRTRSWLGAAFGCGCLLAVGIPALMALSFFGDRQRGPAAAPGEATVARPALSPSGRYRLVVLEGGSRESRVRFWLVTPAGEDNILLSGGEVLPAAETAWFAWDSGDRVWVYSSDRGTSYWEPVRGGGWSRRRYSAGGPDPPAFFRERRPQLFR